MKTCKLCKLCGLEHAEADPPYCTKNRDRCKKSETIRDLTEEVKNAQARELHAVSVGNLQIKELLALLEKHGSHLQMCPAKYHELEPCRCGLRESLNRGFVNEAT